jgi:hypothetical protein
MSRSGANNLKKVAHFKMFKYYRFNALYKAAPFSGG